MRKAFLLGSLLMVGLCGDVEEKVRAMLAPETYERHRQLISLLFENEARFCDEKGCDVAKIAKLLEQNGLLDLSSGESGRVVLTMECRGAHPLFFMKVIDNVLRAMGWSGMLTQEARWREEGFSWTLSPRSGKIPDPVKMAERLEQVGVRIVEAERLNDRHWRYRIDMTHAKMKALPIREGESRKIIRPVRPLWIDVSKVRRLTIRELPGSHWYADVVVYDKMLHLLSMRQNDTRTRYLRLRLPEEAAYVKITDRFTLENIRSGLRLDAAGER